MWYPWPRGHSSIEGVSASVWGSRGMGMYPWLKAMDTLKHYGTSSTTLTRAAAFIGDDTREGASSTHHPVHLHMCVYLYMRICIYVNRCRDAGQCNSACPYVRGGRLKQQKGPGLLLLHFIHIILRVDRPPTQFCSPLRVTSRINRFPPSQKSRIGPQAHHTCPPYVHMRELPYAHTHNCQRRPRTPSATGTTLQPHSLRVANKTVTDRPKNTPPPSTSLHLQRCP